MFKKIKLMQAADDCSHPLVPAEISSLALENAAELHSAGAGGAGGGRVVIRQRGHDHA